MIRGIDFSRLREAVKGPGVDPRVWVCMGRVVDDPDAVVWDDVLGWLCDVEAVDGPLAGSELPLTCRVATGAQGPDIGIHRPPRKGGLVVVVFPSGDQNEDSVILGQLHNEDDAGAPATVNGDTIDEDFATTTHITALPEEDQDEEWANVRVTASDDMKLHGKALELGKDGADQAYMRGDDFADAIEDMVDAIGSFAQSLSTSTPAPPNAALTVADVVAAYAPLEIAIAQFKAARAEYLSTRIKGD
jgi:hypothetical protein